MRIANKAENKIKCIADTDPLAMWARGYYRPRSLSTFQMLGCVPPLFGLLDSSLSSARALARAASSTLQYSTRAVPSNNDDGLCSEQMLRVRLGKTGGTVR